MDIDTWLKAATEDAERRGLPDLAPLLAALAKATHTLRTTRFQEPRHDEWSSNSASHAARTHN